MPHTLDWDGEHLPEELKRLPPGRYVLIEVDTAITLSEDEESGLRQALEAVRAGNVQTFEDVQTRVDRLLSK